MASNEFKFPECFCPGATTLNLFVGPDPEKCYQLVLKSHFALPHGLDDRDDAKREDLTQSLYVTPLLNLDCAHALTAAVPQIAILRLAMAHVNTVDTIYGTIYSIKYLLVNWCASLQELELYSNCPFEDDVLSTGIIQSQLVEPCNLMDSINALPALHSLTLEFLRDDDLSYIFHVYDSANKLTIFTRLSRAHIYTGRYVEYMWSSFQRYAIPVDDGMRQDFRLLSFFVLYCSRACALFSPYNLRSFKAITQIDLTYNEHPEQLHRLCGLLPNLTTLKLIIRTLTRQPSITLPQLIRALAQLKHLHHLRLVEQKIFGRSKQELFTHSSLPAGTVPLPTVQEFHAQVVIPSGHEDATQQFINFVAIFPHLKLLMVDFHIWECQDCGYRDGRFQPYTLRGSSQGDIEQQPLPPQEAADEDDDENIEFIEPFITEDTCGECAHALLWRAQRDCMRWSQNQVDGEFGPIRAVFQFNWLRSSGDALLMGASNWKYDSRYPERCHFQQS